MPKIDIRGALGKKIGPLPAWGWGVAIGGGLLIWRMTKGSGGNTGSPFAFEPGTGSGGGSGGSGIGGGLPDLFEPSPTPNADVYVPGIGPGIAPAPAPIGFSSSSFALPSLSLPSFSGINNDPIASAAIKPLGGNAYVQPSEATSPAVGSGIAGATQARAARARVQEAAAKVATPTATTTSQLATRAGLDATEAIFLVQRQATSVVRTAAKPVAKTPAPTIKPKSVPTTTAPRKTATIRKAPTAVTQTVRELAGPNLRGGTRL